MNLVMIAGHESCHDLLQLISTMDINIDAAFRKRVQHIFPDGRSGSGWGFLGGIS
jgi:hypothetical protein